MLLPAQLYREELKRKMTACWYQPKYKYYFLANYHEIQIGDNADWRRDFVCIYKNEVIGFFSYSYNEVDRSMGNFGLVSFVDNGAILIRTVNVCISYPGIKTKTKGYRAETIATVVDIVPLLHEYLLTQKKITEEKKYDGLDKC